MAAFMSRKVLGFKKDLKQNRQVLGFSKGLLVWKRLRCKGDEYDIAVGIVKAIESVFVGMRGTLVRER